MVARNRNAMDGPDSRCIARLLWLMVYREIASKGWTMLALSRGEGQSIIIDGKIEVKVVKWSRGSVRLAIQAPREVSVDRDEIWRRMHPNDKTPLEKAETDRQLRFDAGADTARATPPTAPIGEPPDEKIA
jgi:carbon storage regulator